MRLRRYYELKSEGSASQKTRFPTKNFRKAPVFDLFFFKFARRAEVFVQIGYVVLHNILRLLANSGWSTYKKRSTKFTKSFFKSKKSAFFSQKFSKKVQTRIF